LLDASKICAFFKLHIAHQKVVHCAKNVQKIPLHIAQAQAGSAAAFYEQYSQPDKQKLATCPKLNKDPCIV